MTKNYKLFIRKQTKKVHDQICVIVQKIQAFILRTLYILEKTLTVAFFAFAISLIAYGPQVTLDKITAFANSGEVKELCLMGFKLYKFLKNSFGLTKIENKPYVINPRLKVKQIIAETNARKLDPLSVAKQDVKIIMPEPQQASDTIRAIRRAPTVKDLIEIQRQHRPMDLIPDF